jgi:hypothetical protein
LDSFVPQQLDFAPLLTEALDLCGQATAILMAKGRAEEGLAYRRWLLSLGRRVAEAAREGGILGIGSARVTDDEKAVLTVLARALGVQQ